MSAQVYAAAARASPPSVEASRAARLLPFMLSVVAGATDVIGFLILGGLFTAHITGNLVVLAAHVVAGGDTSLAAMLSVPVFVVALGLTRWLAQALAAAGIGSLRPLLTLQLLLLAGFLALAVGGSAWSDLRAPVAIIDGMFAVSAMAVQNVLVRISLKEAPATAVMTTNISKLTMYICDMAFARAPEEASQARRNANRTWPVVAGFVIGCGLGAGCEQIVGKWSVIAPVTLALLALVIALAVGPEEAARGPGGAAAPTQRSSA